MKDETALLIKLVNENKSISEITQIMNLSKRQLFQRMTMIKQSGYLISKKYYYNGDIRYYLENPLNIPTNHSTLNIESADNTGTIRMILTSDSHYGNIKEDLECTDKMIDYCTNNNINLIFHLGDFFEGVNRDSFRIQKYSSVQEQIEKTLSLYPMVDNILTITLLGNHDASFWLEAGIDIKTILENRRHDIIPIGYERGIVKVKNFNFVLEHPIKRVETITTKYNPSFSKIFLHGHSHRFKLQSQGNTLNICVPSSSQVTSSNKTFLGNGIPSIIDAEFIINGNQISNGNFNQYILLNGELIKVGEQEISFKEHIEQSKSENNIKPSFNTCFDSVETSKYQEDTHVKKLTPFTGTKHDEYRGMSQLDKFNKRFNK